MKRRTLQLLMAMTALGMCSRSLTAQVADHAECAFIGEKAAKLRKQVWSGSENAYSRQTVDIAARLSAPSSKGEAARSAEPGTIDRHLSAAWQEAGIKPAAKTNDFEFIRRVTLDLTGRLPQAERVQAFVADVNPDKRTALVDQLIGSPEFVDKWTMYFGDLLKNTQRTTVVTRFADGRNAFYQWIRQAVETNKPLNQIATELITGTGESSYEKGELNWLVGARVTGGPVQDIWDQMATNTAQTFLGLAQLNCVMCHDGRRHLDTTTLWGKSATRLQAYQMSAFFSRTDLAIQRVNQGMPNPYYFAIRDNTRFRTDYALNTTSGNRPPRTAVGTLRTVAPEYPFGNGGKPNPNENYRVALARFVTSDFQFARAAVNRFWKEFMVKGMVEPVDQFDLARLDADNPPEAPWTLQPNQPRLLKALAEDFIAMKFDLRALMKAIVLSDAYQLSSRYDGEWKPVWENLYARKLVRRLSAEEVHDAVVQSSGVGVNYAVAGLGAVNWAMKLPDVTGIPAEPARSWLDSFMRGNRDTEERRTEGSILQVLNLMNDNFVVSRTRATGTGANQSLLRRSLTGTDEQLISNLYINVLSRYPNDQEKARALALLREGNRQQKAEDLLWALYNKVDFFFNY